MKNRKPKADGRYVVNVSFTSKEISLLSWADKHGNFSNYVKKLIEADMNKGTLSSGVPNGITNEMLQKMLMNMLGENGLKDVFQKSNSDEVAIDEEKETAQQKPKLNKSAIKGIMNRKK